VALDDAPPLYNRIFCKLFYPAQYNGTDEEKNSGLLPIVPRDVPYPIVVLFNGMNVGKEGYQWLAEWLAGEGCVVLTFDYIADVFGTPTLTPGFDLQAARAGVYGTRPTSTTLGALLNALALWNEMLPLNRQLDLENVVLGGHSAGGTAALQNANPRWFPSVKGAFTYAAHTMTSPLLGYEAGTIVSVAPESAFMLLGGTEDGVIAESKGRYGADDVANPIARTFNAAVKGGRDDCYHATIAGATHFTFAHPHDSTTGRGFLEVRQTAREGEASRATMARLIRAFVRQICEGGEPVTSDDDPIIVDFKRK
jgi:dienelactone hydrolase